MDFGGKEPIKKGEEYKRPIGFQLNRHLKAPAEASEPGSLKKCAPTGRTSRAKRRRISLTGYHTGGGERLIETSWTFRLTAKNSRFPKEILCYFPFIILERWCAIRSSFDSVGLRKRRALERINENAQNYRPLCKALCDRFQSETTSCKFKFRFWRRSARKATCPNVACLNQKAFENPVRTSWSRLDSSNSGSMFIKP